MSLFRGNLLCRYRIRRTPASGFFSICGDNGHAGFGYARKAVRQTGRCGVSPQEGAARNGVRARGRLSPFKIYFIDKTFESRIGLSDTPIKLKRAGILGSAAYVRRLPQAVREKLRDCCILPAIHPMP